MTGLPWDASETNADEPQQSNRVSRRVREDGPRCGDSEGASNSASGPASSSRNSSGPPMAASSEAIAASCELEPWPCLRGLSRNRAESSGREVSEGAPELEPRRTHGGESRAKRSHLGGRRTGGLGAGLAGAETASGPPPGPGRCAAFPCCGPGATWLPQGSCCAADAGPSPGTRRVRICGARAAFACWNKCFDPCVKHLMGAGARFRNPVDSQLPYFTKIFGAKAQYKLSLSISGKLLRPGNERLRLCARHLPLSCFIHLNFSSGEKVYVIHFPEDLPFCEFWRVIFCPAHRRGPFGSPLCRGPVGGAASVLSQGYDRTYLMATRVHDTCCICTARLGHCYACYLTEPKHLLHDRGTLRALRTPAPREVRLPA